ncbi:MAG TPA: hypothetical protein DCO77_05745 [Nitrospiraceae bacterium]|nr:hypothetical protein [Nitrospiraceae bacterium]
MTTALCEELLLCNEEAGVSSDELQEHLKRRAALIYRQLVEEGCMANDVIALSAQLLSFVTDDLKAKR